MTEVNTNDLIRDLSARVEDLEEHLERKRQWITKLEIDLRYSSKWIKTMEELRFTICFLFLIGCITFALHEKMETMRQQEITCQKPV